MKNQVDSELTLLEPIIHQQKMSAAKKCLPYDYKE